MAATRTSSGVTVRLDEREGGVVATLTVDNRSKLNVIGSGIMSAFTESVRALGAREDLRALVVTGAGERAFVGGADIEEMANLDPERGEAFIRRLHLMCRSVRDLPVPVIARIQGYALGAGLELAAACDLRIASSTAVLGMPEVRVGIPSVIEAALLPGLVGWGRARQLVLLAPQLDAEEALRWGLVDRVVAPEALDAAVEAWVSALLAAGPRAIRLQKALVRAWEDLPLGEAIEAGVRCFAEAWRTDEPASRMRAFLARKRS